MLGRVKGTLPSVGGRAALDPPSAPRRDIVMGDGRTVPPAGAPNSGGIPGRTLPIPREEPATAHLVDLLQRVQRGSPWPARLGGAPSNLQQYQFGGERRNDVPHCDSAFCRKEIDEDNVTTIKRSLTPGQHMDMIADMAVTSKDDASSRDRCRATIAAGRPPRDLSIQPTQWSLGDCCSAIAVLMCVAATRREVWMKFVTRLTVPLVLLLACGSHTSSQAQTTRTGEVRHGIGKFEHSTAGEAPVRRSSDTALCEFLRQSGPPPEGISAGNALIAALSSAEHSSCWALALTYLDSPSARTAASVELAFNFLERVQTSTTGNGVYVVAPGDIDKALGTIVHWARTNRDRSPKVESLLDDGTTEEYWRRLDWKVPDDVKEARVRALCTEMVFLTLDSLEGSVLDAESRTLLTKNSAPYVKNIVNAIRVESRLSPLD